MPKQNYLCFFILYGIITKISIWYKDSFSYHFRHGFSCEMLWQDITRQKYSIDFGWGLWIQQTKTISYFAILYSSIFVSVWKWFNIEDIFCNLKWLSCDKFSQMQNTHTLKLNSSCCVKISKKENNLELL